MQISRLFAAPAYRTAAITSALFFAAGLTIAAIGPNLPALASRIGVDVAALGGLFTAFSAGVIAAQLAMVWMNRYLGQRMTLAASALLMGLGSAAIAQGIGLVALFAAALLSGFGFGGILAMGNMLVAQLFPLRSAAALNVVNLFFGIGSIIGPALVASTNTRFGLPLLAIWIGTGVLVALFPFILIVLSRGTSAATTVPRSTQSRASGRSWLLGFLLLLYTGTEIGFAAWLTLYMVASAELEVANAALFVSSFWVALTGGRALAALLGVRLHTATLLRLCLSGLLLGALLLALGIGNATLSFVGVLVFGLSCGPVFPTVLALVATSSQSSAATGVVLALANGGGMLLPALLGLLLTQVGPSAVVGQLILAALLMIILGIAAMRPATANAEPRSEFGVVGCD